MIQTRTLEAQCLAVMAETPWVTVRAIAERIGRSPHHLGPVFARMLKGGRAQRRSLSLEGCSYLWALPGASVPA